MHDTQPIGLSIYDYFVTLEAEVERIWSRKLGGATALFFLNRYVPLLNRAIAMAIIFTWNDKVSQWKLFVNSSTSGYSCRSRGNFSQEGVCQENEFSSRRCYVLMWLEEVSTFIILVVTACLLPLRHCLRNAGSRMAT